MLLSHLMPQVGLRHTLGENIQHVQLPHEFQIKRIAKYNCFRYCCELLYNLQILNSCIYCIWNAFISQIEH